MKSGGEKKHPNTHSNTKSQSTSNNNFVIRGDSTCTKCIALYWQGVCVCMCVPVCLYETLNFIDYI